VDQTEPSHDPTARHTDPTGERTDDRTDGPGDPPGRDGMQDRILEAAIEAATLHGLTRLSVGDVARRAGISRPTLYKRYPSKDALVTAAVQREAETIMAAVRDVVDAIDDPGEALRAGVLTALRLMREHALLDRIVRAEPEALVPLLTVDDSVVMPAIRRPVEALVGDKLPGLDAVARRRIADLLARLVVSYALSAPDDPPEVVADLLAAVTVGGAASLARVGTRRVAVGTGATGGHDAAGPPPRPGRTLRAGRTP
jgi:AcrR family transcriptional regulator